MPVGILMRLLVGRAIADARRIEDHDVGRLADRQAAAIA